MTRPTMTRLQKTTPWGGSQWFVAQTASTMDDARQLEAAGEPWGSVVRADFQKAGVGRFSTRRWDSAVGESLLFTGFWSLSQWACPGFAPSLTLAWGVCQWLETLVGRENRIAMKWPNDVYVNDRKLAGILVRARIGASGPASVHAGIGLNVAQQVFSGEYRTPPISLALLGLRLTPEEALDGLLPCLAAAMREPEPRPFCEERLWRRNAEVTLQLPGQTTVESGRVLGLGPEGQLRWETALGEALVSAGE